MKKSIHFTLLAVMLSLMVGCSPSSSDLQENVLNVEETALNHRKLNAYGDWDVAHCIGQLHNESMYALIDYMRDRNINPYESSDFTYAMIQGFMQDFMVGRLREYGFEEEMFNNEQIELDLEALERFGEYVIDIVRYGGDVDDIEYALNECIERIYAEIPYEQGRLIYASIVYVALYSNDLWGNEWDYLANTVVPEQLLYCVDGSEGDDSEEGDDSGDEGGDGEETKTEEEKKHEAIVTSDIHGAVGGAIGGATGSAVGAVVAGAVLGPVVVLKAAWSTLLHAAWGAAVSSALAALDQDMDKVAYRIHEEDVDVISSESYMAEYLRGQYRLNPYWFEARYGTKFDNLIWY